MKYKFGYNLKIPPKYFSSRLDSNFSHIIIAAENWCLSQFGNYGFKTRIHSIGTETKINSEWYIENCFMFKSQEHLSMFLLTWHGKFLAFDEV